MEIRERPFQDDREKKDINMTAEMLTLTEYHRKHCAAYSHMLDAMDFDASKATHYRDIPFLPVTLFKKLRLSSLDEGREDYKVITSSGTGGQRTSQIVLDGETRTRQQQVLASIGGDFLGTGRMPMLIIDCPATVKKRDHYSARTAAILGFSLFGTHRTYALRDEDMHPDFDVISDFLKKYGEQKFLVFGFTYVIWKYLVRELERRGIRLDMSNAVLVHGGGWKKLENEAVSRGEYKQRIAGTCGIETVMDYYGMAEQSGSIFMECSCGHLHCSDYSAVLIRRPEDFSVCETGETGLIQVLSVIPKSYPGHSLLTEDMGRILGADDCPCGRKGVYFEVLGRARQAELRGCSDTAGESLLREEERKVHWLLGAPQQCEAVTKQRPKAPFDEETLCFLDLLSRTLRRHPEAKHMPDVMSFAFWCRRAHLEQMKKEYSDPEEDRTGRGVSLHFASSNMPVLFGFSLASGLLAGNACIVRLPRKETRQEQVILEVMRGIISESCPEFDNRIFLCRYDHDANVNQMLSDLCDVRVMWGTDASIAEIRKAQLKPGASDICFGTRYSAAILDAKAVTDTEDMDLLVKDFYNDTYLNDQNACSSPRILYWVGEECEVRRAQERFWTALQSLLQERAYEVPASVAVQKMDAALMMAAAYPDIKILRLEGIGTAENTNAVLRVQAHSLRADMWELTVPGGFFLEAEGGTPEGLFPVLDRRCQTLTCYGLEQRKLMEQLSEAKVTGVDRMVDFGHALDFSLTWDRHDLIREMSLPGAAVI